MTEATTTPGQPVASQRIADVIAERILTGRLPPGTRIKQDELAEELRTSRIPVREALRILDSRGLVVIKANSGAWVAQMTLRDLELSYEIRERIEPLLLAESLPRLTPADVDEMRRLQDLIEGNDDVERFLVLDRAFHWASYRGHDTPQLATMVERLWDTTQHYRRAFVELSKSQGSWIITAEHRLLLESVAERDAETSAMVLAMHIRRTRVSLAQHAELFAPTPQEDRPR
jgi:DNA-binding GntR family transcriptional regulator